jgi:hypothetical protein
MILTGKGTVYLINQSRKESSGNKLRGKVGVMRLLKESGGQMGRWSSNGKTESKWKDGVQMERWSPNGKTEPKWKDGVHMARRSPN